MRTVLYVVAAAIVLGGLPRVSGAAVDIQLERTQEKFNLGFSEFSQEGRGGDAKFLSTLNQTIANDLKFCRTFNLLENGPAVSRKSDALAWAKLGSDVVLAGEMKFKGADRFEASAQLYDTRSGKEVLSVTRRGDVTETRWVAHEFANEVVKYFTGRPGFFHSKIAFVNDTTGRKELYVADFDGKNVKRLTNDNSIVILPRFSPDGKQIAFTSYVSGKPDLYLINTNGSGRKKVSIKSSQLNVSPSWSPQGDQMAVTLSLDGRPNIYLIDLFGGVKQRLTDGQGADTAPSFSPDGSQISFTSDRAGYPHIYVVGLDGSGLRRLTTASHCDSSAWSPDGQNLLYVKSEGRGRFDIYSIEILTGVERRLTWAEGDSENPAWSPDGRFVLFTSNRRGKYMLYQMNADGTEQKALPTVGGESTTPAWSPQ